MAHELEIVNGEAQMFSVKETPWHGLGKIVQEAPTAEQAIELAGLNWTVSRQDVHVGGNKVDGYKAIVRDSDSKTLGIVSDRYNPLQNKEVFNFFNPFVSSGNAQFETAGSLRGGKTVWALAKLNIAPIEVVKDDVVQMYLLMANGHDGTRATSVALTGIRVVCANTLAQADRSAQQIRVFHSKDNVKTLEMVRDIVNVSRASFEATAEQYKALAQKRVNQQDLERFVKIVFKLEENPESERTKLSQDRLMSRIKDLFQNGYGQQIAGVEGTYWALYNGVTQYLSYEAGRAKDEVKQQSISAKDTRLNSLWFGPNAAINQNALKTAVEMATVAA